MSYDPIPTEVRAALAALREIAGHHGLDPGRVLFHASFHLAEGEEVTLTGSGRRVLYWPCCGAGEDGVVSPAPKGQQ